jgi:hypothetical protein
MELLQFLRYIVGGHSVHVRAPLDLEDTRVCVRNAEGVLVPVREIRYDEENKILAVIA